MAHQARALDSHASHLGWWSVSPQIIYMLDFMFILHFFGVVRSQAVNIPIIYFVLQMRTHSWYRSFFSEIDLSRRSDFFFDIALKYNNNYSENFSKFSGKFPRHFGHLNSYKTCRILTLFVSKILHMTYVSKYFITIVYVFEDKRWYSSSLPYDTRQSLHLICIFIFCLISLSSLQFYIITMQHSTPDRYNTASILTRRRRFSRSVQDVYYLPIMVSDGGIPSLSSSSTLTIRVCACERDGRVRTCHAEAFLSSAGLSTGALIAILLCVVILLAIVVLFITLRRSKKEPLIISEEDVRENVVTYDDEGGGEEDTEAFDITALRNPSAAEELKYRRDIRPEVKLTPRHQTLSTLESIDVQEFIKQRLAEADLDPSVPPYDSLQTYAYEGQRSEAGSISSLDSATTQSDQDYQYLGDWGPEFKKLAELYGETESERTT
ncbi:hypothetical protein FD755_018548 [Muntiacus reevesi]|uniref:Cadherin domain-containing protein n=1 Tax=Muntiacus reevesi TaxID=9886 RepID=A0A5N3X764_MUNRE|nr:hypothetical protein FD755_018548 [Muntiacus reevesi]